ncbi:S-layer homology domain-containing protein [Paenibacillus aestuarii]|uniref:S-layer homology domain-containing protein n=1 Tax=Paenibacillus aestuarii TaxID=516965 RepID=A0ABW0K7J4_9BACL|nr:S-layer homology domain-containing protein [Paenibacillus aestuarii]
MIPHENGSPFWFTKGLQHGLAEQTNAYLQADIAQWALDAVATLSANHIMDGYANGTFMPQGQTTRAEAVTAVFRAFNGH